MSKVRVIARLDIKGPNLIKGIHLEGLRVVGDPHLFANRYYESGADELLYIDIVASLYGRNNLIEIVKKTAQDIFIPLTVGGGVRTIEDARQLLRVGADKIAINTAATQTPNLISEMAHSFGSQCVILSIEAKRGISGKWEALINNGRDHTELDVVEWAKRGEELGAGEILLTSIDQEGTRKGFDIELVRAVATSVSIPVIASGGMGNFSHFKEVVELGRADAVAIADVIHYDRMSLLEIRKLGLEASLPLRAL